jgi:G:T/U-mismatch repair DNA glycosylase
MPHIQEAPIRFDGNDGVSANETFRVAFPKPIGNSDTNQAVAKYEKLAGNLHSTNDQYRGLDDSMVEIDGEHGVDRVTRDLNLITRSVASSEVSKALNLNAIVDEAYGRSPDNRPINVSAMSEGTQVIQSTKVGADTIQTSIEFKFNDPAIQKGLYDLEAVDYLTGQIDRHGGNFFINPDTGAVQGIDNDLCFGSKPLSEAVKDEAVGGKAVGAPPLYYQEDTARRILELSPERLEATLRAVDSPAGNNRLSDAEIQGALQRLDTMKQDIHIARLDGRVVQDFTPETFTKSLEQQQRKGMPGADGKFGATGNYVARCHMELETARNRVAEGKPGFQVANPPDHVAPDAFRAETRTARTAVQAARNEALAMPSEAVANAANDLQQRQDRVNGLRDSIHQKLSAQKENGLDGPKKIKMAQLETKSQHIAILDGLRYSSNPLTDSEAKLVRVMAGQDVQAGSRLTPEQKQAVQRAINTTRSTIEPLKAEIVNIERQFLERARPELNQLTNATRELEQAKVQFEQTVKNDPRVLAAQQRYNQGIEFQKNALENAAHNPWQRQQEPLAPRQSVREALLGAARRQPAVEAANLAVHQPPAPEPEVPAPEKEKADGPKHQADAGQNQLNEDAPKQGRVSKLREQFESVGKGDASQGKTLGH